MRQVILLFLAWLTLLAGAAAENGWEDWLSPRLRVVESQQREAQQNLEALKEPMVSQTVPQFGFMVAPWAGTASAERTSHWVQIDLGESQRIDRIALIPVRMDWHLLEHPAFSFPNRFRVDVSDSAAFENSTPIGVFTDSDFPNPGDTPVLLDGSGVVARHVRLTVSSPRIFSIAEIMVMKGNRNIAINCEVSASGGAIAPPRWALTNLVDGRSPLGSPILYEELPYDGLYAGPTEDGSPVWIRLDFGKPVPVEEVRMHPIHGRLGTDIPGYRFPTQFRLELSDEPSFADPTVLFETYGPFSNPGNNAVTIRTQNQIGRYLRVLLLPGDLFIGERRFGLSELEVYSEGENVARQAEVESVKDPFPARDSWPKSLLVDGCTSYGRILELPQWLDNWTRRKELKAELERLGQEQVALLGSAARRVWLLLGGLGALSFVGLAAIILNTRRIRNRELTQFRKQLASDLHDEIGSSLAAIAGISENAFDYPDAEGPADFQNINRIARETTDAMRETLWVAGFSTELGIDLMKHLRLTAARMLPRCEVLWTSVVDIFPQTWPVEARRQVFLFFKETLANIVRHSRANKVELSAKVEGAQFILEIRDNGKGFQPDLINAGIGLESLRQRAGTLRGSAQIETKPGAGTHVVLRVPMKGSRTSRLANLIPKPQS